MKEIVEFATQIVILGTAILGFYKVYTIAGSASAVAQRREKVGEDEPDVPQDPNDPLGIGAVFGGLLKLIGVIGYFILIPVGLLAFVWFLNLFQSGIDSFSKTEPKPPFVIQEGLSKAEIALIAAMEVTNHKERTEALKAVVTTAIRAGEFDVATRAAEAISDHKARNFELNRVVEEIQKAEQRERLLNSVRDVGSD